MTVYDILDEVGSTSSRLEKEATLKREKDNAELKMAFKLAYDPTINFWIKKIPGYEIGNTPVCSLSKAYEALEKITSRQLTGNAAIEFLSGVLSNLSSKDANVLELIIKRDLDVGATASTANKVWKDLIPEYPYMRCALPKAVKLNTWDWKNGIFSQLKADGSYANLVYANGEVSIMTRSGTVYPLDNFSAIVSDVQANFTPDTATHGELLVRRNGEILPREIGNGILNSVAKGGNSFVEGDVIEYLVWDQIPLSSSVSGGVCRTRYENRYHGLLAQLKNCKAIQMIETRIVYSLGEAYDHYNELVAAGMEGSIIKTKSGIWKDTTSKDQVKLKVDCDIDLEILGFNPGNGKNANTFGSIRAASSDRLFEVNVSGFKDDERLEISENRASYMNTIMTVRINNIMKPSKEGKLHSAFLPRKIEFRTDKTEADSLERIFEQFESVIRGK